ncbi:hypothetical protein AMK26_14420 [Streptomyces sp. CB03234]|uniref:hypothetical protein n=1 Tax=Streptomyces sp. (strain CB03234) TaxID=1703937 RepID=UPI00093CE240|nr:hypothetical protein [Streptomyces sp. CB03234]OKK04535.1 hypothetical protein AMK26_14420 [Streptomyces sp. CB03234]
MSEEAEAQDSSDVPRCPDCGEPVVFGEQDTTAMGQGGHERRRGAAVCMNEDCVMFGEAVNLR